MYKELSDNDWSVYFQWRNYLFEAVNPLFFLLNLLEPEV